MGTDLTRRRFLEGAASSILMLSMAQLRCRQSTEDSAAVGAPSVVLVSYTVVPSRRPMSRMTSPVFHAALKYAPSKFHRSWRETLISAPHDE